MPIYNVYMREMYESCYEIRANSEANAIEMITNGGGHLKWRDFLEFTEDGRWNAEVVGLAENEDEDLDEPDEAALPVPDDGPIHHIAVPIIAQDQRHDPPPDIAERVRRAMEANPRRRPVPAEPEPVEDVDFEG
jgi:hypothetical protein